jgi:signal recognition particle subunit SRP54
MFDALSGRLGGILRGLRNRGRLTERDVDEALAEVRTALLDADVNLDVVGQVVAEIRAAVVGAAASKALDPGQQVVKAVHAALVGMLGGETLAITYASEPPTVVLMAGLQGSGKTTSAAKLAAWYKSQGRQPLLVGADLQRPAAVEQLRVLAGQVGAPMWSAGSGAAGGAGGADPVATARGGVEEARRTGRDVVILDTAGRLAIDDEMMAEIGRISAATAPRYTFLVVDAMVGQDAVTVARRFDETLAIDGVILTKLDGDARGGAALSVKRVLGKPIAFAATGEKLEAFEQFHPDRMAGRILGMGDMLTLIEQAERAFDQKEAEATAARLLQGEFTLEDFLAQLQQLKKMGSLSQVLGMLPGVPREVRGAEIGDDQVRRTEAIIRSMTPEERARPEIINGSRRARIARGSGMQVADVNRLVKQFLEARTMMKRAGKGGRVGPPAGFPIV